MLFFSKNQGYETKMSPEEKLHRLKFLEYLSEYFKELFYLPGLLAFICSKSTRETREQFAKSLQNEQPRPRN